MKSIVRFALENPLMVLAAVCLWIVAGAISWHALDIEAYPNPVPPLVEVIVQPAGWSAQEVERQVTVPLEIGLAGMPGLDHIRSQSLFGLSDVKCYFKWGSTYDASRQEVLNRLGLIPLPVGLSPQISPWNAIGEVYRYVVTGSDYTLEQKKTAEDWILEPQFRQVPGVADVTSFGGLTRQYQVEVDPVRLAARGANLAQVSQALSAANVNVGGDRLDFGEQSYTVRGIGLLQGLEDIRSATVASHHGVPVRIADVADVRVGYAPRQGMVGKDTAPDVVQGIVLMKYGGSTLKTLAAIRDRIRHIRDAHLLPPGMDISTYYDRGDLVKTTTRTVVENLLLGMGLVTLVLFAFLGSGKASLIAAINIPLALLASFFGMVVTRTPANLISLGAVDFGIVVDSTVIVMESIMRHLDHGGAQATVKERILAAASEVGRPLAFSTAILGMAFIPLFTLDGVEGVIFNPMARTYAFAIGSAVLLSLTLTPVLAGRVFRSREPGVHAHGFLARILERLYFPLLRWSVRRPGMALLTVALPLALCLGLFPLLGMEFMPHLEEGNLWIRASLPRSISLSESAKYASRIRGIVGRRPEVTTTVSQTGRPDDGTDVSGFDDIEIYAPLKPQGEWPRDLTKDQLTDELSGELRDSLPGVDFNFSQMIGDNVEEAMSGVKGENSVKVIGSDLAEDEKAADRISDLLGKVEGVRDVAAYPSSGQPSMRIEIDRARCAAHGLNTGDVASVIQAAIGGQVATQVFEGEKRFDLVVRWKEGDRSSVDAIRRIPVAAPDGSSVPLGDMATIRMVDSPSVIYREDGSRYTPVKFSVRGRDLAGAVRESQAVVRRGVTLPWGTFLQWDGEMGALSDASAKLAWIVPITLLVVGLLVQAALRDWTCTLVVFLTIPLAAAGGIVALFLSGTHFSISAAMGFISAFGISIQDALLVVGRFRQLRGMHRSCEESALESALQWFRPAVMATLVATLGLLPAAVSHRIGSQTQKPLALVVIGCSLCIAFLVRLVTPALLVSVHRTRDAWLARGALSIARRALAREQV